MALEYISEILAPRLFAASVQSTLLVAVVWTLCRLLPRLPAAARCWLWWLVALQLVVGVLWTSPLALPLLPADSEMPAMLAPLQPFAATAAANATAVMPAAPQASSLSVAVAPPSSAWSWPSALSLLWLLGLSFMITRTLVGYLATRRLLRESVPCRDATLVQALKLAAEAHGMRKAPTLRLSSTISSPQLIGPWSPVLMLPAHRLPSLDADELDMALTHELTHLQRGDLWWGLLPALAQHVFFFHPLAHLAAREYAFAREAACDAAVLAGNPHCAGDYGRLLVRLGVAARPSAGLASASPTFLMLKRRLLMLQQNASPLRASALALTLAVALVGVVPYRVTAHAAQTIAPTSNPVPVPVPVPMETPNAMASSQTMVASRIVPAPPAAPAPPKAPPVPSVVAAGVPAVPPAPPLVTRGSWTHSNSDYAYVLIDGTTTNAVGSTGDLRAAKSQQRNGEALLWVRKDGNKYVVRDAATLRRLQAAHAPVAKLGEEQGQLGAKQGELGAQQGGLGARQGEIGAQQGELAAQLAAAVARSVNTGSDASEAEVSAIEQRLAALGKQQDQLGREQHAFESKQQELSRQQQALGERQRLASEAAQRETDRLIDAAIAKGLAQRLQ
ncbi:MULTISPECIES: M56 family metallopeptidase [unclassified Pseudoxanthomonas]|uniref:M56 family metallopeptidase n=1 Tax=unclassified Pseudoxanthomonas TaxID=2645906 RepID=UPI003078470F